MADLQSQNLRLRENSANSTLKRYETDFALKPLTINVLQNKTECSIIKYALRFYFVIAI
jgi:hypothetical protein